MDDVSVPHVGTVVIAKFYIIMGYNLAKLLTYHGFIND